MYFTYVYLGREDEYEPNFVLLVYHRKTYQDTVTSDQPICALTHKYWVLGREAVNRRFETDEDRP